MQKILVFYIIVKMKIKKIKLSAELIIIYSQGQIQFVIQF